MASRGHPAPPAAPLPFTHERTTALPHPVPVPYRNPRPHTPRFTRPLSSAARLWCSPPSACPARAFASPPLLPHRCLSPLPCLPRSPLPLPCAPPPRHAHANCHNCLPPRPRLPLPRPPPSQHARSHLRTVTQLTRHAQGDPRIAPRFHGQEVHGQEDMRSLVSGHLFHNAGKATGSG